MVLERMLACCVFRSRGTLGPYLPAHVSPHALPIPNERAAIACSRDTCSHGSNRVCAEMALEGVPECCSGARARRERRLVDNWWTEVVAHPWKRVG